MTDLERWLKNAQFSSPITLLRRRFDLKRITLNYKFVNLVKLDTDKTENANKNDNKRL